MHEPAPASGFVTVTVYNPTAPPPLAIVMFTDRCDESVNVTVFTVILFELNDTVAPLTKFVPMTVTVSVVFLGDDEGLVEVTVGPALTVKQPVHDPLPVFKLVTVTLRAPVVAPAAIVMLAVTWVALLNVVELTVMPVPENEAVAPLAKFVPVIAML